MADLSTLDPTQPPGTQAASQGDDRIRETRDAIINSFGGAGNAGSGGTQPEHNLNGVHHFRVQDPAFRPAAGNAGRLFFDATNLRAEYDNGSAWNVLHAVNGKTSPVAGLVAISAGVYTNVTTVLTFNAGVNSYAFFIGTCSILPLGVADTIRTKFILDGSDTYPGEQVFKTVATGPAQLSVVTIGAFFGLTSGSHVLQYVAKADASVIDSLNGTQMAIVF